jgi:hypothetical protein
MRNNILFLFFRLVNRYFKKLYLQGMCLSILHREILFCLD